MELIITNYLPYIIVLSFAIGVYVLKQNHREKQNITFFVTCLGISLWVLGICLLQTTGKFYIPDKLTLFGGMLMVAGLFYFSQVFPTAGNLSWQFKSKFAVNAYARLIPFLVVVVLLPFNLFIKKIEIVGSTFTPINGPLFPLYALCAGYYIVSTIYFFAKQYLTNIGYKRQRVSYAILGLIFFLVCAIIFDVILPAFNLSEFKFIGPLSSVLFFVLGMFSIISYNLMDIRLVLKSVLVYTLTIVLGVIAVTGLYESVEGRDLFAFPRIIFTFFTLVVMLIFIRVVFEMIFKKYFMQSYENSNQAFHQLNTSLYEITDPEKIIVTSNSFLKKALKLSWVYYFDPKTRRIIFPENDNPIARGLITLEQTQDQELYDYAGTLHSPKFFFGAELSAFPKITNTPIALLPIWENKVFHGYFLLGPQRTLSGLSVSEMHNIQAAWAHIETALSRAQLHQYLEQKVQAQVKDITYKNKVLKEMLRNQLDFVQVASHQLRTPLTTLSGHLQILLNKQMGSEDRAMVELAYENTKDLTSMVKNILRLARVENMPEKLADEKVSLNEVLKSILPVVRAAGRPKDLYISFEEGKDIFVFGNKAYLQQAFFNILENAAQYTEQGGVIITIDDQKDYATVCIEDSGPGISQEAQQQLFQKHAISSHAKGTGLGLYIVKSIIDAHQGGEIRFETGEKGTRFFVKLRKFRKE